MLVQSKYDDPDSYDFYGKSNTAAESPIVNITKSSNSTAVADLKTNIDNEVVEPATDIPRPGGFTRCGEEGDVC
jgi:hypothetical protein